jgi:mycothiol synthase
MSQPPGAEICMFAWTDLPGMVDLSNAAAAVDQTDEVFSLNTLHEELEAHNDPESDCFVAVLPDGRIVGYAYVELRVAQDRIWGFGWGTVHPEFRRQGIGKRLALAAEGRFSKRAALLDSRNRALFIQRFIHSANTGEIALARALGYRELRSMYRMGTALDRPYGPVPMPEGFDLRPFDPKRHARAVYEADTAAFMDGGGETVAMAFEDWCSHYIHNGKFDPALWLVAWAGDEVAALCFNQPWGPDQPDLAWLAHLGVLRRWRRRGLGAALLLNGFSVVQQAGFQRVALSVRAESIPAVTLYQRAGMAVCGHSIHYRKILRGDPAAIQS